MRRLRELLSSHLMLSVALLGVVLSIQVALFGPGVGVTADEFALLAQIDALESGSWTVPHPLPEADPGGTAYVDHLAGRTDEGFTPYSKHPLPPLALLAARDVVGPFGPRLVVATGQLLAALAVARLVRRVARAATIPAFWLIGLASPLALHAHVLWMHSWGLALAAIATEAALVLEQRERRRWVVPLAALLGSVGLLVLVRTEGILFCGALGFAVALTAWRRRSLELFGTAIAISGVAIALWWLEGQWIEHLVGTVSTADVEPVGWVESRSRAISAAFLLPGESKAAAVMGSLASLLFLSAAWCVRRHRPVVVVVALAATGGALHITLLYVPYPAMVPGLLPALPLLILPLVLPRGAAERDRPMLRHLAGASLVLVALTAYPAGAGIDWGGRYALLAIPALAALSSARLVHVHPLDRRHVTAFAGVLLAVTVAAGPVVTWRVQKDTTRVAAFQGAIDARVARAAPSPVTGKPVVIALDPPTGRVLATRPVPMTPLRAETTEELRALLVRLRSIGVSEVLLIGWGDVGSGAELAGWSAGPLEKPEGRVHARRLWVP